MKWLFKIFGFSYSSEPKRHHAQQKNTKASNPGIPSERIILPNWYKNITEGYIQNLDHSSNHLIPQLLENDIQIELENTIAKLLPESWASLHIVKNLIDENISTKKLAGLVISDPVLSKDSQKIVNSATFGLSNEITYIHQAITLMSTSNSRISRKSTKTITA